jgi:hypothetical protein
MTFTGPLVFIFILTTVLELLCFLFIKQKTLRYLMLFCAVRNVICFSLQYSKIWYWDTYWTGHEIVLCWMAWIAGEFCAVRRFVRIIPFITVAVMSLFNLSWRTMPAAMYEYAWHASTIITGTCVIALLLRVVIPQYRRLAAGFALLAGSSLASSLWWFHSGSRPVPETFLWCVCLIALLAAVEGSPLSPHVAEAEPHTYPS